MTTLFYKKVLGHYVIAEIIESEGCGLLFKFEAPTDAKLTLCATVYNVRRGVCEIKNSLPDGKVTPKLYSGGRVEAIESFTVTGGAVSVNKPNSEILKSICSELENQRCRIDVLSEAVELLKEKTERKFRF